MAKKPDPTDPDAPTGEGDDGDLLGAEEGEENENVAKADITGDEAPDGEDLEDEDEEDTEHTSVIVALWVDPEMAGDLAVEGGIDPGELHITLAYISDDVDEWDANPDNCGRLLQAIGAMALNYPAVTAVTTGFGILQGDPPDTDCTAVALIDSPAVTRLQRAVTWALSDFGIEPVTTHGFLPHISLAYGSEDALKDVPLPEPTSLIFSRVTVAMGGQHINFPLNGPPDEDDIPQGFAMVKAASDLELGYTLAPLYVPGASDSHGEYATADDLRSMAWDFFRKDASDRNIYLQHAPGVVAGELVDQVVWPFEVVCELQTGTGITKSVRLPPGTVYQGILWQEWAQPLVKEDKITGLSMGGTAFKAAEEGE